VRAYGAVIHENKVTSVTKQEKGFKATFDGGLIATARKVLLTTGLKDYLPEIDGVEKFYGRSVHHCPYCDGYENRGRPIAIYGKGDKGANLALMMKQWTPDVILCSDGESNFSKEMQARLEQRGIKFLADKIVKLEGDINGHLERIIFAGGKALDRSAMFFTTGCAQRSDLWEQLGCKGDADGGIISDPLTEESSIPGVYVAGDASRDVLLMAVAVAEAQRRRWRLTKPC
jgi:thioredoxin reductase